MKIFAVFVTAAAFVAFIPTVNAQRLLRSEALTAMDSTISMDLTVVGSGSGLQPNNMNTQGSFGSLELEGSTGGDRQAGSMHDSTGRVMEGYGMTSVGFGDGFVPDSGSFAGHDGSVHRELDNGSFSVGTFAGSVGDRGFGGSFGGGSHFGGSLRGNMPSVGSSEDLMEGSREARAASTTTWVAASSSASS